MTRPSSRHAGATSLVLLLLVTGGAVACGGGSDSGGSGSGDALGGYDGVWFGDAAGAPDGGGGGGGKDVADPPGGDAPGGGRDTGGAPDDASAAGDTAGPADAAQDAEPDAGGTTDDAAAPGELTLALGPLPGWQRGPVTIGYTVEAAAFPATVTVEYRPADGDWAPATALTGYGDPPELAADGARRFVWDSFADAWSDAPVDLRVSVADAAGATASEELTVDLRNAPDRDRVVLVTSAINGNDKVRRLRWRHGEGLSWDGNVTTVGARAVRAVFEPGGRAAAVLEEDAKGVTFFGFTADGAVSDEVRIATPAVNPAEATYAGDGAALYVLSFDSTAEAGVYRIETDPTTGLPAPDAVAVPIYARTVASELALRPDGEGLLVYGGTMMDPLGDLRLDVIAFDGTVQDWAYFGGPDEGFLAAGLGLSPDGRWILAGGHSLFGPEDQAWLFALGTDGTLDERDAVSVSDPDDIAFHSSSLIGLVSEVEGSNSLFPVVVTGDGRLEAGTRVRVSLAEQIAHTTVGADRDRFLVTTVSTGSGIAVVHVAEDGTGTRETDFEIDLGEGIDVIPSGLAIQP